MICFPTNGVKCQFNQVNPQVPPPLLESSILFIVLSHDPTPHL